MATSAYEHCTDHQNYAYKVLAQTVETGLRYHEKTFSNVQKKERQNHSHSNNAMNGAYCSTDKTILERKVISHFAVRQSIALTN